MSAPREIISSLGRRGSSNLAVVEYLLEHGPTDTRTLGRALYLTNQGVYSQLTRLHTAGVLTRLPAAKPNGHGHARKPWAVDRDALAYAGHWLLALSERNAR